MEKDVVFFRIGYHFTQGDEVKRGLLAAAERLEVSMAELGVQVRWTVDPIGSGIGGSNVGVLGPPPRGFVEVAVEDANLDREDSEAGRRIRDLLSCNNEELRLRRVAEVQIGRRDIIIECLLDSIQIGGDE